MVSDGGFVTDTQYSESMQTQAQDTFAEKSKELARKLGAYEKHAVVTRQADLKKLIRALAEARQELREWARVDLLVAFDPEETIRSTRWWASMAQFALGFGFFVPLVITWAWLHEAIGAYNRLLDAYHQALGGSDQALIEILTPKDSFFSQWTAGFPEQVAGWLGDLNKMSVVAAAITVAVLALIFASLISDLAQRKLKSDVAGFRSALMTTTMLLTKRYADGPTASADLTDAMITIRDVAEKTLKDLENTQKRAEENASAMTENMAKALANHHAVALERLKVMSDKQQQEIRKLYQEASSLQADFVISLNSSLAQCTQTMTQANELVAIMRNHTEGGLGRAEDTDRILSHLADSAGQLRDSADQLLVATTALTSLPNIAKQETSGKSGVGRPWRRPADPL